MIAEFWDCDVDDILYENKQQFPDIFAGSRMNKRTGEVQVYTKSHTELDKDEWERLINRNRTYWTNETRTHFQVEPEFVWYEKANFCAGKITVPRGTKKRGKNG